MKKLQSWDILGMILGIIVVIVGIIVLITASGYSTPDAKFGGDFNTYIYAIVYKIVYCLLCMFGGSSIITGLLIFIYFGRENTKDKKEDNEIKTQEITQKEIEDISNLESGSDSYKPAL